MPCGDCDGYRIFDAGGKSIKAIIWTRNSAEHRQVVEVSNFLTCTGSADALVPGAGILDQGLGVLFFRLLGDHGDAITREATHGAG